MYFQKSPVFLLGAFLLAAPAGAQDVKLEIRDGRASLTARNAAIRQILGEWARLGGTKIVGGEKIAGAPVTLQFIDLPERQALEIVLRNVSGYLLAPRPAGTPGASTFDRILILPTSVGPRNPAPAPAFTPPQSTPRAFPFPQPMNPAAQGGPEGDNSDPGDDSDAPQAPAPGGPGRVGPGIVFPGGAVPGRMGVVPRQIPGAAPQPGNDAPPDDVPEQAPPQAGTGQVTSPRNPFGVPTGSGLPGVVTPVPPPANPNAPRPPQ